jgi:hypothetical protein
MPRGTHHSGPDRRCNEVVQAMLNSFPIEMLWLAFAFVVIMAGMLAAAPE